MKLRKQKKGSHVPSKLEMIYEVPNTVWLETEQGHITIIMEP